jgi:hypothetical protein
VFPGLGVGDRGKFSQLLAVVIGSFLILSGSVTPEPARAADTQVSVFAFPNLNGSAETCDNENYNLERIVAGISGFSVDTSIDDFTDPNLRSQLDASEFFFMTDLENRDPNSTSFFPVSAQDDFEQWVDAGGVMVMTGTGNSRDVDFLNLIFDWDLTERSASGALNPHPTNRAGTPYENFSGTLVGHSATTAMGHGTVPNVTSMWGNGSDISTVATIEYGRGTVIYLGWDFYDSGPGCDENSSDWVQNIIPASLNYAAELSQAGLENISSSGGDLKYTFSQTGTAYWVVTDQGVTPTTAQIKAADITGETVHQSDSVPITGNVEAIISIGSLNESQSYSVHIYTEYDDSGIATDSAIQTVNFSTLPGTPTINSITPADQQLDVSISKSGNETGFQFSTNGGSSWSATQSFDADPKTFSITSLTNGTSYDVRVRSVFDSQTGAATESVAAVPTAATRPDKITSLSASSTPALVELTWTVPNDNNATITDYKVEVSEDGANWTLVEDGVSDAVTVSVTGLSQKIDYLFRVSAINSIGTSDPSDPVGARLQPTPPYSGPVVTNVKPVTVGELSIFAESIVRVTGLRLSGVSKVVIEEHELELVESQSDYFLILIPKGITPGTYDLQIFTDFGNLTYLDGITIQAQTRNLSPVEFAEVSSWTKRISDDQVKVYVKFPTVGEKVRISHQTGGSGSYETVYVRTTSSETMEGLRVVEGVGTYIVRTIDLADINRIRVTVGDEEMVQVRYNR